MKPGDLIQLNEVSRGQYTSPSLWRLNENLTIRRCLPEDLLLVISVYGHSYDDVLNGDDSLLVMVNYTLARVFARYFEQVG